VTASETQRPRRVRLVLLLPLGLFVFLAAVFLMRLESGVDPSAVPSVLIGKPAPAFALPALEGLGVPGLARADLEGKLTLVNIFASWCVPCRQEHPLLVELAKDRRIQIVGIDYKDTPENALRFLASLGNPYARVGVDRQGRTFIDWGAYGVPETFLVGPDGVIISKIIGPLTPAAVNETFMPEIAKAAAAPPA
jgi:cytochrome c biogenesis protein CcmG/thiol:disulfide interchange protein DsbE